MTAPEKPATDSRTPGENETTTDAVVVGAGWGGMYMLVKLRELGMSTVVLEKAPDVGGTWYWNAYPGARCDVPVVGYSFSFSEDLQQEWEWSEKYASQPEILEYARHTADRFDLRRDIRFSTEVVSAEWREDDQKWTVRTDTGQTITTTYLVMATGGYSAPIKPDISGLDDFRGEIYYTNQWPHEDISFDGKRIGVVGTGSSGIQTVSAVGRMPIEHLYVFQRTPNFSVPAHNGPWTKEALDKFKEGYPKFREDARHSGGGNPVRGEIGPVADLPEDEFQERMQRALAPGGTAAAGVTDCVTSKEANLRVQEFLRSEVRRRVKDPVIAEKLCADDHWLFARRDLYEINYYETYNQDNVTLVDLRDEPIEKLTDAGLQTSNDLYELDMLILATGFDSGTGALRRIDIRGTEGATVDSKWAAGPDTYLGLMLHGFPNMFSIAGPGSPSIRSNVMVSIEQHVEWLAELFAHLQKDGITRVEPTKEAESDWTNHVNRMVDNTILMENDTQYNGANVPGKPRVFVAYIGGVGGYRVICDRVRDNGYEGFAMARADGSIVENSADWSGPPVGEEIQTRFGIPFM